MEIHQEPQAAPGKTQISEDDRLMNGGKTFDGFEMAGTEFTGTSRSVPRAQRSAR